MTLALTRSVEETTAAGRAFAATLRPGDVVAMVGELGAGETSSPVCVPDWRRKGTLPVRRSP